MLTTVSTKPAYPDSYYAASASRDLSGHSLAGETSTDICVIGGGYSGLSTAIHLAEKGYQVCLLESRLIGWGASGRNGGQIVNGLNASLDKIWKQFGEDTAHFVGGLVTEGSKIIRGFITGYDIDCDYRPGNMFVAHTQKHMQALRDKQALWQRFGMNDHEIIEQDNIKDHIATQSYVGGMLDHSGGHVHPLKLALGEARALKELGGQVYENTTALSHERRNGRHIVSTETGRVFADHIVFCGNAYRQHIAPEIKNRVMPVSTQMIATEPLGDGMAQALLPTNLCVEDCRYILDYYRLSADNRLIFGGGTVYGGTTPKNIEVKIRPNMLKVFPQLKDIGIDYAWSGNFALSYSRVPQLGRLESGIYFAHGYSGHGVTGSHLFGKILAEAIDGDVKRFDVFSNLPYLPFPGGYALSVPYSMIGSWWYALRDRLGV